MAAVAVAIQRKTQRGNRAMMFPGASQMSMPTTGAVGRGNSVARITRVLVIGLFSCLAVSTGFVAVGQGVGEIALPYELHLIDLRLPGLFRLHMISSGVALALIPFAIHLRRNHAWHRPLGGVSAAAVCIGACSALPVAFQSTSADLARAGFAVQAMVWFGLVIAGVVAIRRRNRRKHACLMLAMAVVASGAIWVRMATVAASTLDLPFDTVYSIAAWASWIVPLAMIASIPGFKMRN